MNFTYKQSDLLITPDGLAASIWFDLGTAPYQSNNQQQRIKWKRLLKDAADEYEDHLRHKFMLPPWRTTRSKILHDKSRRTYHIRMMFWFISHYPRPTPTDWCYTPENSRPFVCRL